MMYSSMMRAVNIRRDKEVRNLNYTPGLAYEKNVLFWVSIVSQQNVGWLKQEYHNSAMGIYMFYSTNNRSYLPVLYSENTT